MNALIKLCVYRARFVCAETETYIDCVLMCDQKHGLKIIPRNTTSFTPVLNPEGKRGPASLTLGADSAENVRQIAQFSQKDAQVGIVGLFRVRHSDLYLFTSELFLPFTVIVQKHCGGAPSKVYQWLGPRCRHKMTLKHFTSRSPNFYRGQRVRISWRCNEDCFPWLIE